MADNGVTWSDMDGTQAAPNGGLVVKFYRDSKRDVFNSIEGGFPIDKGIDRVKVSQVGEKDNAIFDVDASHKARWPNEWRAYQEGREQRADGTSIDLLYPGDPDVASTLRANNIFTVEQLANFPDSTNFAFAQAHKRKAQQFLDGKKANAFPALQAEIDAAKQRENALMQQLSELSSQVQVLSLKSSEQDEPVRRGPGRPPNPKPTEMENTP